MESFTSNISGWETSNLQVFWGEIAPCDHMVQIYENEKIFLDTLEGFAGTGFLANDSVVIIATSQHLEALNTRLDSQGFDLNKLIASDQYVPIDANDLLSAFLVNDWIDERIFNNFVTDILHKAKHHNGKVRAFGEMVAILWDRGLCGATVQLEDLWNRLHENSQFSLYCAYPKIGFTQSSSESIDTICKKHARVIDGQARPATDIYYKSA
jgi:hypothetical protein